MQTFIFSMWIKFGFRGRSYTDGWEKHSSFSSVLQLLNLSVKCRICSAVNLSQRWRRDVLKVKQGLGVHASKWTGWTNWNCWVRWILCWFSLFPVIADSVRKFKILFYFLNFFRRLLKCRTHQWSDFLRSIRVKHQKPLIHQFYLPHILEFNHNRNMFSSIVQVYLSVSLPNLFL